MVSLNQRLTKLKKQKHKSVNWPQKKAVCLKQYTQNPKKPNSANRAVAKIRLKNKSILVAAIGGEGHSLQPHSIVQVAGARLKDLPGVQHRLVRGKFDLLGVTLRKTSRSKYGTRLLK